jgi:energy-coupling factor transport system permease protein
MKLPYKSVLVTSLATRFVPLLTHDAERITDVQKSRGLDFEYGSLIQRTGNRMAVLIPLLSNSLDRAVQVAEAMESRAFGSGEKRSFYKELRLSKLDILMLMVSFLTIVLGIFMRLRGMGDYAYFPALGEMSFSGTELFMLFWLVFLLFLTLPVAWLKKRLELD